VSDRDFVKLIVDYGNASFDCGKWDEDTSDESYEDVLARQQSAYERLLDACSTMALQLDATGEIKR
jgi:hypothetical protein